MMSFSFRNLLTACGQHLRQPVLGLALLLPGAAAAQTPFRSLNYLYTIRGTSTIGGMHNKEPLNSPTYYTDELEFVTGKVAGLWGGDFLFNSYPDRWQMIYEAEKQWQRGAFVTLTWHACNPAQNVSPCSFDTGVKSTMSDADWTSLTTNGTVLNNRWKAWLDELVPYFQYLQSRGVEVAFRPLHETNQPVFWWGGRPGPNGSAKLYQITHDYLQGTRGLTNIIWVWNIQDFPTLPSDVNSYSPGAGYFDVASLDFYNGDGLTPAKYNAMLSVAAGKPIAIGETGVLPTPAALRAQPLWTYFMGWSELVFSQNTSAQLLALYTAPNVLTRDEMPGWGLPNPSAGNLALNRPVTVSSTEQGQGNVASLAVDGDRTTRWSSAYADPQQLVVDLGANYNLNRFNVVWENAYGRDYQIQVSPDNVNWTTAVTVSANSALHNDHPNLNVAGRYVKVLGTARGTSYGYSIRELEAYGSLVTSTTAATAAHSLHAYPNPAAGTLTVALGPNWPVGTHLMVLSSQGQQLGTYTVRSATQTLPTADLPAGLYLLRAQYRGMAHTIKFIKQ
ncbi:glycosyl hydrolase [Hymenobacter metallicola]|uniref:T9SS type A sorting domain-containing protein n=1 Tax=Hymenobacter metallicola TaxID=2563114 RepID=A0A4Z0PTE9_9BACT|nr:glycosyl hydrolase [Hymenobacter metallicola]TGE20957.1 T9SS type A sorting domain-containing protein [Hymenobacter metallicola]